MLYPDEYNYFKSELEEDINKPYTMSNSKLAFEFYKEVAKEYSEATIHCYSITQFICITDKAREEAFKMLETVQLKLNNELQEVLRAKKSIEKVLKW